MLSYLVRRILLFIPSLFLIVLAAFIINSLAPGDPVMRILGVESERPGREEFFKTRYAQVSHQLGLDLPLFYISVKSFGSNDSNTSIATDAWKKFIPVIRFNHPNQFHRWVFGDGNWLTGANAVNTKGIIRGDFGRSYISGKNVGSLLSEKLAWTMFFSLGGILLACLIGVPLGIYSGSKSSSLAEASSTSMLVLHSVPGFFIATLLLMLFANTSVLNWLPASGVGPVNAEPSTVFEWISIHLPYIILPLICYMLGSLPFLVRTVRSGMREEMKKNYIVTAHAKGLDAKVVTRKHAFRNALFPLITLIAYLFPGMIGGSAILETVFSIPGLGLEIVNSIFSRDYPVIIAIFTLSGILTITGFLISDICYSLADPRIKLN